MHHRLVTTVLFLGIAAAAPVSLPAQCGGVGSATLEFVAVDNRPIGPGSPMILRFRGAPRDHFCVICDDRKGVTRIPGLGRICLPATPNFLFAGVFPDTGQVDVRITLPRDPRLANSLLCCQMATVNLRTRKAAISNLVCACLGNPCEGKVQQLGHITALAYRGPFPVRITAETRDDDAKGDLLGRTSFLFDPASPPMFPRSDDNKQTVEAVAALGGRLIVTSAIDVGSTAESRLPNNTWFSVRAGSVANTQEIHTSCSRPLGVGMRFGPFTITSFRNTEKGNLCTKANKPRRLTMRYTGEDCSASKNGQQASKWSCSGDPRGAPQVTIRVSDDDDPTKSDAKLFFSGTVRLNGTFTLDAAKANEDRLPSNTYAHVMDASKNVLQTVRFHTSCSAPIRLGDQWGSLVLVAYNPR